MPKYEVVKRVVTIMVKPAEHFPEILNDKRGPVATVLAIRSEIKDIYKSNAIRFVDGILGDMSTTGGQVPEQIFFEIDTFVDQSVDIPEALVRTNSHVYWR